MSYTIDQIPTTRPLPRVDDYAELFGAASAVGTKSAKFLASRLVAKVENLAALIALDATDAAPGLAVHVQGFYAAGDGGGGLFRYDPASALAPVSGMVLAPGAGPGNWLREMFGGATSILHTGASTASADNSAAIQAAIDWAAATSGLVWVPAGEFRIQSGLVPAANVTIDGVGAASVIRANADNFTLIDGDVDGDFAIRNVALRGYADVNPALNGNLRLTNVDCTGSFRAFNVFGTYARGMGITGSGLIAEVEECRVENILRDAVNLSGTFRTRVKRCKIKNCGDDSIAVHMEAIAAYALANHCLIVDDNEIEMAYGIKILGAQVGQVTNNRTNRMKGYHLFWASDGTEGRASMKDLVIANNVFKNVMNGAEWGGASVHYGIYLDGVVASGDGTLNPTNLLPGEFDDASNTWLSPDTYDRFWGGPVPATPTTVTVGAASVASLTRALITHNQLVQDLPPAALYSDLGYGMGWNTGGAYDATTLNFVRLGTGLRIGATTNNVAVHKNFFYGWAAGMQFGQWPTPATTARSRNIHISENHFIYCVQGIDASQNVATVNFDACRIERNTFDLDPFFFSADRNADGSWANTGTTNYKAINLNNTVGWFLDGNSYKNLKRSIHGTATYRQRSPIYYAEPINATTGHRGVDGFDDLQNGGVLHEVISDKTNAAYRGASYERSTLFNLQRSGAMPAAGWYMVGAFVTNSAPAKDGNNMVVIGWARKTTGTTHIAGTDWETCYASTVSPAN